MELWTWTHMETWTWTRKTAAQAIFLNPLTVCLSCLRKFVVCSFVDDETNGSYPKQTKRTKRTCPSMAEASTYIICYNV
jgi:hypothetical protein